MLSPLASGLYQNVIMESGTAVALSASLERDEADFRARYKYQQNPADKIGINRKFNFRGFFFENYIVVKNRIVLRL